MRSLFSIFILFFPLLGFSQKTINVMGTSEMQVSPTIFKFSIVLAEYEGGKNAKTLKELEKELLKSLNKNDIPLENLKMTSFRGASYLSYRKRDQGFRASKNYLLTINDPGKLESIFEPIDPKGIYNVTLIESTRDDLLELKKENRIKALQASLEKATYLLESIGKRPGEVIQISEEPLPMIARQPIRNLNTRESVPAGGVGGSSSDFVLVDYDPIEFKKIKILNRIYAVYEIEDKP